MAGAELVLYQEEFQRLDGALKKLRQEANARAIFLIDKNGQQIAAAGEVDQFDTTSLASLTAGNVAATDGLAKRIGERAMHDASCGELPEDVAVEWFAQWLPQCQQALLEAAQLPPAEPQPSAVPPGKASAKPPAPGSAPPPAQQSPAKQ